MDEDSDKSGFFSRIRDSFRGGIRPGFLGGAGGGEVPSGSRVDKKAKERATINGAAAGDLKDAEGAASGGLYRGGDGLDETRDGENEPGGFYRKGGSSRGLVGKARDAKNGKYKGLLKHYGPVIGVLFVILGVGGIMAGSQAFQPFSLVAQFQESFNSMHIASYQRSARFIRWQLDSGRLKNPVKGTIFSGSKFVLSEKQISEYAKQGITYNDNYEGKRVLEYDTDGGQHRIVTATKADADALRSAGVRNVLSIDAAYNDSTFGRKFTAASQTWRGQFASWFGTRTIDFFKNNKLTRNMFKDFKQQKEEAIKNGKTGLDVVKEDLSKRVGSEEGGGIKRKTQNGEDDQGNVRYGSDTESNSKIKQIDVSQKLNNIKSKISGGVNIPCAVMDFIGVVSLMVTASEALQIVNLTTAYMEAVDKTKAGYGDEAPINELTQALNEQVPSTNVKLEPGDGTPYTENGNTATADFHTATVESGSKSAMQSAGMAGLYGNGYVDPNDASVQSFNLTGSLNTIMGGLGLSAASFQGCAIAKATAAAASIATDILGCVLTGCSALLVGVLAETAIGVAASALIGSVIAAITPWLTTVLTRDLISTFAGEALGNALVYGANEVNGRVFLANGGSLATKEVYEEFIKGKQQVITAEAKVERENLSPFDITSKNTFMGTILTQMMNFMTSNSLMNTISKGNSVMSNSMVAVTPSASATAYEIANSLPSEEEYAQICPYLASIGAVGDSFCNPYMAADMSMMDVDPADVIDYLYNSGDLAIVLSDGTEIAKNQFDEGVNLAVADLSVENEIRLTDEAEGENVKVVKDSDLMKYITYCLDRVSPFGVVDQNIADSVDKSQTGNFVIDTVLGVMPIVGDIADIVSSASTLKNIGYISGESCVAGNNLDEEEAASVDPDFATESPKWDKAKYYQLFVGDQSLAESMGIIEKSAVTVAMEEYYEENPLDESYEGQLARWSGLDKETVSDALDVIAYYNYINNYDASERYAFGAPVVDEGEKDLNFENEYVMDGMTVALEGVVYTDVRNRTFVV